MSSFHDAAYTMAAVSATVALFRALVAKGVLTRDEAVRVILDASAADLPSEPTGSTSCTCCRGAPKSPDV